MAHRRVGADFTGAADRETDPAVMRRTSFPAGLRWSRRPRARAGATFAVDLLVDGLGRAGEVGHDEPGIVLGVAARMPDDLGLDDHAAPALPRLGGVAR